MDPIMTEVPLCMNICIRISIHVLNFKFSWPNTVEKWILFSKSKLLLYETAKRLAIFLGALASPNLSSDCWYVSSGLVHLWGYFIPSTIKQSSISVFKSKSCFSSPNITKMWTNKIKRIKCCNVFLALQVYVRMSLRGNLLYIEPRYDRWKFWMTLFAINRSPWKGSKRCEERANSLHCTEQQGDTHVGLRSHL